MFKYYLYLCMLTISTDALSATLSSEAALLLKFTERYALPIYSALQECLKEESEKTALGCKSGLTLLKTARNIIKERNMPVTPEEESLFNTMEEKYSNGPSNVNHPKIEPKAVRLNHD